jgi:chorismate mutase-like protein
MGTTIHDWRAQIDIIDSELLRLLNRRAQLAIEIGALKRRDASPLCDPSRERQVLVRALTANSGPLDDEAVANIFRSVIDESRRVEELTAEPVHNLSEI